MDEATARAAEAGGKAVAETAKLGGKLVDAASGAGGYIARTLGTIPEDALGLLGGDWLHEKRRRTLRAMQAKTAEILERIGQLELHEPSPSVVVPLLQAAADEARPELQELWAALLASALQADGGTRVRRAFFDTLRQMEPEDALLFRAAVAATDTSAIQRERQGAVAESVGLEGPGAQVAWQSLHRLGLLDQRGLGTKNITPYGMEFWRACNP
jgi:hypothetical protein